MGEEERETMVLAELHVFLRARCYETIYEENKEAAAASAVVVRGVCMAQGVGEGLMQCEGQCYITREG